MNNRDLYVIPFKGLAEGVHSFEWVIDSSFFALFETSEINNAHIGVSVTLTKHTQFLELDFELDGWAEVMCDRCLDLLKLDIESEASMYVKFGNEADEDDQEERDIVTLPYDENELNVAQYMYEYAHLSLPVRRVHPDDETGQSTCNKEMIGKLSQYLIDEEDNNPESDPRWNDLKNVFEN